MPKVSVLMPVYKTNEKFLKEAIESILSQTFTDFEFLILDDCPLDDREKIIKSYKDDRIKYFKNDKNLGISETRNKLINMASGEYLAVFDHDDISKAQRFEKQVAYLDAHLDVGVVGCKFVWMSSGKCSKNPINDDDIKLSLMRSCAILHPSSMIRKSVLIDNNIRYEEKYSPSEDYALWCKLISFTKFHNLDEEILFCYRDHTQNTSHQQSDKMQQATLSIWNFVKYEQPMLYDEFILKARLAKKIKLFGIPILRIISQAESTKGYLFCFIPIFSIKSTINWRAK